MDKVARIVSQDFHSPDGKIEFRKRQLEFQRNMDEVELIISVDTADDAMMTIFVFVEHSICSCDRKTDAATLYVARGFEFPYIPRDF